MNPDPTICICEPHGDVIALNAACPLHGDDAPPCYAYHRDDTDEVSKAYFRGLDIGAEELAAAKRYINNLENELRKHSEFGGMFQPGGRFNNVGLRLGSSCVVEGGKWLIAEFDQLQRELAEAKKRPTSETATLLIKAVEAQCEQTARVMAERDQLRADLDKALARLVEAKGEA